MINNATFQIIGRIGKINALENVTHISLGSDRSLKKDGAWVTQADWNEVTLFNAGLRNRFANEKIGKVGNKMIFQGSIQPNVFERDGEKHYKTTLAAHDFDVMSFAKDKE